MTTIRSMKWAVAMVALGALAGCSLLQRMQDWLPRRAGAPATAAQPARPAAPVVGEDGLAPISDDQIAQIRSALAARKTTGPAAARAVRSAAPVIEAFVRVHGCITAHNGAVLDRWTAPGQRFDATGYRNAPIAQLQFHDRTACATVRRFQNWSLPARQVLRFEIVYVGDDGEHSVKTAHELRQQADGGWLFAR